MEVIGGQKPRHRQTQARRFQGKIVGDDIVHRAEEDDALVFGRGDRAVRQQRLQHRIFALREGEIETGGRHKQHRHLRGADRVGQTLELNLHHFGGTRGEEEDHRGLMFALNLGNLVGDMGLRGGQIGLFKQRNGKARAGEDHHSQGVLQQVGAGMGAND